MKKLTVGLIISGSILLIQGVLALIAWGTKASWWWAFWFPLMLQLSIIILVVGIIFLKKGLGNRVTNEPKEPLPTKITQAEAKWIVEKIIKEDYANEINSPQERQSHIGRVGTKRVPIYHYWGKAYYMEDDYSPLYYIILDMNDTSNKAILKQENHESDKDFKVRVKVAIMEFAQEQEVYETELITKESPEGIRTTVERKRQTITELQKKKEEETKEKAEVIGGAEEEEEKKGGKI